MPRSCFRNVFASSSSASLQILFSTLCRSRFCVIEQRRQFSRLRFIPCQQELQSLLRRRKASRCVEARAKTKSDVLGHDRRTHCGDLHQLPKARALGSRDFNRAALNEDAIFVLERDDVGHRPKRNQIEVSFQVEVRRRPRLEQRVAQFKNNADAAEVLKRAAWFDLGIHHRDAIRQRGFRFVMIEDDDVDAAAFQLGDFRKGGGAAINRDQELRMIFLATAIDALRAQPVAFLHPQRQE